MLIDPEKTRLPGWSDPILSLCLAPSRSASTRIPLRPDAGIPLAITSNAIISCGVSVSLTPPPSLVGEASRIVSQISGIDWPSKLTSWPFSFAKLHLLGVNLSIANLADLSSSSFNPVLKKYNL